jgi:uncharacterized tellurite resistance protein B-like protein
MATKRAEIIGSDTLDSLPADMQSRTCVAALLWQMATVDGDLDRYEYLQMVNSLKREFKVSADVAIQTLDVAAFLNSDLARFNEFAERVAKSLTLTQRQAVYELVWSIAKADGVLREKELEFAGMVARRLKLSSMT